MVVGAFPVAKLGALVLKQVSKPLANAVKARAKTSPFFRTWICMPPAQFYHWAEVKMKMWSMNLGKPVNIPKLNEALAIDLGAELLGEGIIFVIAAGILIAEYVRSSKKEERKEEERKTELIQVQNDLRNLYMETAKQDAQIRELVRILKIQLPEITYTPTSVNQNLIPLHHKESHQEEEEKSYYSYVKGWVWSAIDVILPAEDETKADTQAKNKQVPVLQVVPADKVKGSVPPSTSTSSTQDNKSSNSSNNNEPKR